MKTKLYMVLAACLVLGSFGVGFCAAPDAVYDLGGEWNVVVTMRGLGSGSVIVEKGVTNFTQDGNTFLGVRATGGKFVSKGDESIKGRIVNGVVEEVFIAVTDDPVMFTLKWNDARAVVAADGNTIMAQTFNASTNYLLSVAYTRK